MQASDYYVDGRYEECVASYTAAIASTSGGGPAALAPLLSRRAAALIQLGRYEDAMADAIEALRASPDSHLAAYRKGVAAFWLGEFESARDALRMALDLAGSSAAAPTTIEVYRKWLRKTDAELRAEAAEEEGGLKIYFACYHMTEYSNHLILFN